MTAKRYRQLLSITALVIGCCRVHAQQSAQFIPEVDLHVKMTSMMRLRLQTSRTIEGGDPTQFTVGPDLEIYLKPLVKLKQINAFDLDDTKSRPLVFSAGYRWIGGPDVTPTNRTILTAT